MMFEPDFHEKQTQHIPDVKRPFQPAGTKAMSSKEYRENIAKAQKLSDNCDFYLAWTLWAALITVPLMYITYTVDSWNLWITEIINQYHPNGVMIWLSYYLVSYLVLPALHLIIILYKKVRLYINDFQAARKKKKNQLTDFISDCKVRVIESREGRTDGYDPSEHGGIKG